MGNLALNFNMDILVTDIVFFLFKTGETMFDSIMRPEITVLVCGRLFQENRTLCGTLGQFPVQENMVQVTAAKYVMAYRILANSPSVLLGLTCGAWSDRFGRKIPMILPSIGCVLGAAFCAAIVHLPSYALELCLCGASMFGVMGKSSVVTMVFTSYISDISNREDRTRKLGYLFAMLYLGIFSGNLLAGFILQFTNFYIGMYVVIAFQIIVIVLVSVFIHEPSDRDFGGASAEKSFIVSWSNIKESVCVLFKSRNDGMRNVVVAIFCVIALQEGLIIGEVDVLVLFLTRYPLSWPTGWYGFFQAAACCGLGLCYLLILPMLTTVFKVSDTFLLILCFGLRITKLIVMSFSKHTWMVIVSAAVGLFSGVAGSTSRSLLSKSVETNELGKIFAVLASAETFLEIVGSLTFTSIYGASAMFFPGLVFHVEGSCFLVLWCVSIWLHLKFRGVK